MADVETSRARFSTFWTNFFHNTALTIVNVVVEIRETEMTADVTKMEKEKVTGVDGICVELVNVAGDCLIQLDKEEYYNYHVWQ